MPRKSVNKEQEYRNLTLEEHVKSRAGMYIGSIITNNEEHYILDENKNFVYKKISFNSGLFKIIDEIFSNASDHSIINDGCDKIWINVEREPELRITVKNNSSTGISIKYGKSADGKDVYNPELVFGYLLTSSNYDETEARKGNGVNGLGAKLTNLYSKEFSIDCYDGKKRFQKTYYELMTKSNETIIKECKLKEKPYVQISFIPELSKFHNYDINDDFINYIYKRVYDLSFVCNSKKKCDVYLNNELITIKNKLDYIAKYNIDLSNVIDLKLTEDIDVSFIYLPHNELVKSISFINNNFVEDGTHIQFITKNIYDKIKGKCKNEVVKKCFQQSHLTDNCCIFMNCYIDNPDYDSQCKTNLRNKFKKMTKSEIDSLTSSDNSINAQDNQTVKINIDIPEFETFINKIYKCGIMEVINDLALSKEKALNKKTDGIKTSKRIAIDKYESAKYAGTKESYKCLLIITEGDSAKTFADRGRALIGTDYFGVFPIRGKMLNALKASNKEIAENTEITNIKKIIGLKNGEKYTKETMKNLNYGGILILSDQDLDGYHIKGLVITFIHTLWPELVELGYCMSMNTPIKKAIPKNKKNKTLTFYTEVEYNNWINSGINIKDYTINYYKGLGSSTPIEVAECFKDFWNKIIYYQYEFEEKDIKLKKEIVKGTVSKDAIYLAFHDDRIEDRKNMIQTYNPNTIVKIDNQRVLLSDYVNSELIHYFYGDVIRTIPFLYDGLKPSQRKILYTLIKYKIDSPDKRIKVSSLSGKVNDATAYTHGPTSLEEAIINMGQSFPASNNINLIMPEGEFGTIRCGGADHASSRYIFAYLNKVVYKMFRSEDECILKYAEEEGQQIEPIVYYPIVPLVLINGATGIGTGYATSIPSYNPHEIINNLRYVITHIDDFNKNEMKELIPYYNGYKGTIEKIGKNKYISKAKYETSKNGITIYELPIEKWTDNYASGESGFLNKLIVKTKKEKTNLINDYLNESCANDTKIQLYISPDMMINYNKDPELLEKTFKLTSKINSTNMWLHTFNDEGLDVLVKYDDVNDIIIDFYNTRIVKYDERKEIFTKILKNKLDIYNWKLKFIKDYINGVIVLTTVNGKKIINKKQDEVYAQLEKLNYPKLSNDAFSDNLSYSYTHMDIYSLTEEEYNKLKKEYDIRLEEYNNYVKKTSEDIWLEELDELEDAIYKFEKKQKELQDEINNINNSMKGDSKKTRKSRK